MSRLGVGMLALFVAVAIAAPWLAPNPPDRRFDRLLYAPPTRVHLYEDGLRAPFVRPWRLVSRLERRFEEDADARVTLRWFEDGRVVTAAPDNDGPLLLLGADGLGRDIYSRLLHASRVTLALALSATLAATMIGVLLGGVAGLAGGWVDGTLMRAADFLLVLPALYVVLALRAAMPLVVDSSTTFAALTAIFAVFGWPVVARGVRAIVISERQREHIEAVRALGAGPWRVLTRHLLPAAWGHVAVQAALLLPAFILAEATMSYIGLGFPDRTPTWGTMLQEAANVSLLTDAPWMLAPAGAIFLLVLAVNLLLQGQRRAPVQ